MRIQKLLLLLCVLIFSSQLPAADTTPPADLQFAPPGSEFWNDVRQRDAPVVGISQVKSTDANVLINVAGESWRQYRVNQLIPIATGALVIVLALITMFRVIRGRIKLPNGRSSTKIRRFSDLQRLAHWSTAILFVILGLTGLVLLLGRTVILPMLGSSAFAPIAAICKNIHDYLGPLFILALGALFILFVKGNWPSYKLDMQWLKRGGGLFGKHAHADRYNAGEKLWFWVAAAFGLAAVISGTVLDFPIFGQTRATMELSLFVHSISAMVMIVFAIGHIYMGTAAMEGTFEVMQTGYCDSNWAMEHHDNWYDKVKNEAIPNDHINAGAADEVQVGEEKAT